MAQLTVRDVDETLHKALKREALERGQSVNKYVLDLLQTSLGLKPSAEKPREFDDLDHLAGTWTKEETEKFNASLKSQRQIDEGLWT